jgi:hypothetical protein
MTMFSRCCAITQDRFRLKVHHETRERNVYRPCGFVPIGSVLLASAAVGVRAA